VVMVFDATFNNISVIYIEAVSFISVLGVTGENYRPVASY